MLRQRPDGKVPCECPGSFTECRGYLSAVDGLAYRQQKPGAATRSLLGVLPLLSPAKRRSTVAARPVTVKVPVVALSALGMLLQRTDSKSPCECTISCCLA